MKINIGQKEIIHFIGMGGIGMSGLAQIMKNSFQTGYQDEEVSEVPEDRYSTLTVLDEDCKGDRQFRLIHRHG